MREYEQSRLEFEIGCPQGQLSHHDYAESLDKTLNWDLNEKPRDQQ